MGRWSDIRWKMRQQGRYPKRKKNARTDAWLIKQEQRGEKHKINVTLAERRSETPRLSASDSVSVPHHLPPLPSKIFMSILPNHTQGSTSSFSSSSFTPNPNSQHGTPTPTSTHHSPSFSQSPSALSRQFGSLQISDSHSPIPMSSDNSGDFYLFIFISVYLQVFELQGNYCALLYFLF